MARLSQPERVETVRKNVPTQRLGEMHEIADATVFLLSRAGDFVNGEIIVVDGGAWHRQMAGGLPYPESVLSDSVITGVKGMKDVKSQSKL